MPIRNILYQFKKRKILTKFTHASVHEGKKPYKCHICNAAFAIKSTMRKHLMYMHSEKKPDLPIKCDICDKAFREKSKLNKHIDAVHEEKKPFTCAQCEAKFAKKSHLDEHVSSVHDRKKPFECEICFL